MRIPFFSLLFVLCTAIVAISQDVDAHDWSQFRGPGNSGRALESAAPPVRWGDADQVAWETAIPGVGWSSPVCSEGLIWLTTALTTEKIPQPTEGNGPGGKRPKSKSAAKVELRALAIAMETGKVVHSISLAQVDDPAQINPMNSYASPTPAIEAGKVVCHFGSYGTWCLDAKTGAIQWAKRFVVDHGVGPGSSPVVYRGNVILVCDGIDQQYVVAVDLKKGDEIWRTARPPMRSTSGEQQKAYCTPLIEQIDGRDQAIIPGAQWIVAYDPIDGKEIWRADHGDGFSVTPMAIYESESGLIVFSTGYMVPQFVAVDPTGTGDVTKTHLKWRARGAPTMASFIVRGGHLYAINNKGILFVIDVQSGQQVGKRRVGGNFSASPLLAAGNLYLSSREGVVSVVRCDDTLDSVATNRFASSIMASPAVVENDLIFRTEKKLYRIKNE